MPTNVKGIDMSIRHRAARRAGRTARFITIACAVLGTFSAAAQPPATNDYPSRPIRFVVPFGAGGASDITARLLGARMQETLGQRFVVDNRGGAGGMVGTDIVAKAQPDGYTILLGSNATHAIVVHLYKKVPYDPLRDFAPVGMVSISPQILAVNNDVPVKSVKELVALAKTKPGALTYASSGTGSAGHICGEML